MPGPYKKTGRSNTKEYKAEYMRGWRKRPGNKDRVIANNAAYWQRKLERMREERNISSI